MHAGLTVQSILQTAYPAYERTHKVPAHVRRAMRFVLRCGTGELGTYERRCPDGHYRESVGRSCRHRACPRCAWRRGLEWLEGWRPRLLPGTHFHTVFTLPTDFHPLWRANRKLLAELLLAAAWDTLREVLGQPQWEPLPGLLPGVLIALHTWNRALLLHLHVHCLVSAGGLGADGQWLPITRTIVAPAAVLRKVFRAKFVHAVERAWKRGTLALPPEWSARTVELALQAAASKKWNVWAKPPYEHGMGLAIYLARYVCGGAIGDRRIVAYEGERVTFVVGRQRVQPTTTTVPAAEFIRRLSEHLPQPGQRLTRAYGLYAATKRKQLAQVRAQLTTSAPQPDPAHQAPTPMAAEPRACCPVCGKPLQILDLPPPLPCAARLYHRRTLAPAARPRGQPAAA
jgi:hypothetical protein